MVKFLGHNRDLGAIMENNLVRAGIDNLLIVSVDNYPEKSLLSLVESINIPIIFISYSEADKFEWIGKLINRRKNIGYLKQPVIKDEIVNKYSEMGVNDPVSEDIENLLDEYQNEHSNFDVFNKRNPAAVLFSDIVKLLSSFEKEKIVPKIIKIKSVFI